MRRLKVAADSRDPVNLESPDRLSEDVDLEDAVARMSQRAEGIYAWLREEHSDDLATRAYLDEGTVERAWWHSGYAVALNDAIRLLTGKDLFGE